MSASDDAYRAAEKAIAEAKREGAERLSFDSEAFHALDRLPPEIAELTKLQYLDLETTQVGDLTPLAACTGLQAIRLINTRVSDVSPLAALTELQELRLDNTQVSDLTPLAALTKLQLLDLDNTQVNDLTPLANLTGLQRLDLGNTQVSDLAPLANLTGLQRLDLDNTQVSDLVPLAALTRLQSLSLDNTEVSDLAPLANLTGLQRLDLDNTQVSDLVPLAALTRLQSLSLDNTEVSDLAPLANLTGLQDLYLTDTQVSDLAPLAALTGLQVLYLTNTQVSDLAPLAALTGLQVLYLTNTQVSDLAPLAVLTELQRLGLTNTQVSDLRPLRGLTGLAAPDQFSGIWFSGIPACADLQIARIAMLLDPKHRASALLSRLNEGDEPPDETAQAEPDLETLLQGPILSDALADVEKVEERFEAVPIDNGPERTPDKRYRQIIETLAYGSRKLGGTATENRIGRELAESFRDYAECLVADPPNARMLNYIGQSIAGVMQDEDALASLDGFDKERIKGFLTENDNLIRGYFPSARKAAEYDTETAPEILAKELPSKIAGVREITVRANADGLFADSVVTALDVLNRRAEGAIKVYVTTDNDKARDSAIKELRRASVLVTAFVGKIKGRLVQWLKAQGAYIRDNPYTVFAVNVTVMSSYQAAYANTIDLAKAVVAKITPIFESLWQLVGKMPLPF